jgi:hypothetical protein
MRQNGTTSSQKWVASKAVSILRDYPKMGAKELQQKLQNDHKVTISYNKVWRGKEVALAELYGKWDESFELLFRWKATGKPEFAVRENLCRAFFFGRTAKRIFTVRFLHSARRKKRSAKKMFVVRFPSTHGKEIV